MVGRLIEDLLPVLTLLEADARAAVGQVHQHVDLVEGQPVVDLAAKALEHRLTVPEEGVDIPPASPAAVAVHQSQRLVKVAQGHQGLNAITQAGVDHLLIEPQALLVGLRLEARGEDAAPGDREAVALETQLVEQCQVLPPVVVQVNGLAAGEIGILGKSPPVHLTLQYGHPVGPPGDGVHHAGTFAAFVATTLTLVGGGGAAPEETLGKSSQIHDVYLLISPRG